MSVTSIVALRMRTEIYKAIDNVYHVHMKEPPNPDQYITFIELPAFKLGKLLTDDEYRELQSALIDNPKLGPVVSGTGGFRKVRWAPEDQGKSGALRVIYYNRSESTGRIYMTMIFPKNVSDNLSGQQKSILKTIAQSLI